MTQPLNSRSPNGSASGFGMIEILIAMFLLALLAMALLPLLISSAQLSSRNVTLTTATQLVNEQMDVVRGLRPSCSTITTHARETVGLNTTDPRGTVLVVDRVVSPCPATYPGLVEYTARARIDGSVQVLAEATTRIFVISATGTGGP